MEQKEEKNKQQKGVTRREADGRETKYTDIRCRNHYPVSWVTHMNTKRNIRHKIIVTGKLNQCTYLKKKNC